MYRLIMAGLGVFLCWAVESVSAQTTPRGIVATAVGEKKNPSTVSAAPVPVMGESIAYEFVAEKTGVAERLVDDDVVEVEEFPVSSTAGTTPKTKMRSSATAGVSYAGREVSRAEFDTHVVRYPGSHPGSKQERYPGDGYAGTGRRPERYPGDGLGADFRPERFPGDGLGGFGWGTPSYPAYRGGYGGYAYGYRPYGGTFAAGARFGYFRTPVRYLPRHYTPSASYRALYRGQVGTIRVVRVRR